MIFLISFIYFNFAYATWASCTGSFQFYNQLNLCAVLSSVPSLTFTSAWLAFQHLCSNEVIQTFNQGQTQMELFGSHL